MGRGLPWEQRHFAFAAATAWAAARAWQQLLAPLLVDACVWQQPQHFFCCVEETSLHARVVIGAEFVASTISANRHTSGVLMTRRCMCYSAQRAHWGHSAARVLIVEASSVEVKLSRQPNFSLGSKHLLRALKYYPDGV